MGLLSSVVIYKFSMKKITTLAFLSLSILCYAQNASVEKSVFGIQTGFLGIWAHNESRLSNKIALRSEIGFDAGYQSGFFYPEDVFFLAPVFTLEPRFYYNLNKRNSKSKVITNNSGNFISIRTSFTPDWFVIANVKDISVLSEISFIPSFGIRRNIGTHFNYEAGLGFGYKYIFAKVAGYSKNESEAIGNIHLRIGYVF